MLSSAGGAEFDYPFLTQKERDTETGLDYFLARYYSSAQGRFTSVDPGNYQARGNLADPQSLKAFSYTNNNPLRRVDPTGKGWLDMLEAALKAWWVKSQLAEEARASADEALRREEIRQYSESEGLNGYVILSEADGSNTHAVAVDELSRSEVLQISQTNRYLAAGINVGGVRPIDQNDALNLVNAVVFRGGPNLEARSIDVKVDKNTGMVQPGKGVSVNSDPSKVQRFGGSYKVDSVPSELEVIQRGANPSHFEIAPRVPMKPERYQELLNQVKLTPVP